MVVMPPQNRYAASHVEFFVEQPILHVQCSVNESEGRYLQDGFWQHGRFYGSWKPGKYLFPIDSVSRLQIRVIYAT
jgi:hypothetical protein